MSISPSPVRGELIRDGLYSLARFDPGKAPIVAGWVAGAHDLLWLAPKTYPPLTPAKVIAWTSEDGAPMLFHRDGAAEPLGYVELNPMPGEPKHLWMGHCVIDQQQRGRGLGQIMVRLLVRHAFEQRRADRVSLVVFPDNFGAIACYRSCGFVEVGTQSKFFYPTGRQHTLLQMNLDQRTWRSTQG
jgi:RimJ/RimL family protein N-acetyltransferase